MTAWDDDLSRFAADGAPGLPAPTTAGFVEHAGARIWHATFGDGRPVILLHGGLGHSGNWGYQVPQLLAAGYQVILVDSRGHGRSTRDAQPFGYDLMATDVRAVMDTLDIAKAALVGWSDGASTALVLASQEPERVEGVFFFACNMDPSGTKDIDMSDPLLGRCFGRHVADYARLSDTPGDFQAFAGAIGEMQATQPNYSAEDLAAIGVPVTIALGEGDEFIKREHAAYLAQTIPDAQLVILSAVTHFAPLQRPEQFNAAVLGFLDDLRG